MTKCSALPLAFGTVPAGSFVLEKSRLALYSESGAATARVDARGRFVVAGVCFDDALRFVALRFAVALFFALALRFAATLFFAVPLRFVVAVRVVFAPDLDA